jgi:WD40 repeat protein
MGVVYQARHLGLNRLVALKMLLAGGHAGQDDLARFRTEAEAIARLQHPHIVQIHEVGGHGGLPFFSLEFCPGGSLAQKLAGTPLPPREAAALVETLARAMQAAHDRGVIHRDLKPANVLLAEDGTPKVSDFGLAKKLDEAGQTASGAVMGTPSYMAPEQAEGKGKDLGPACDVYALGAILYECLTGRPPFKAATALDTLMQVMSDEPVPPRALNGRVPRDLETVCLKCLHKEAGKRYATADALAEDLRRWQAGEPVTARPVGRGERLAKWVCRRPAAAALVGVSLLAAVSLLAGGAYFTARLAEEVKRAQGAEKDAAGAADEARQQQFSARQFWYAADINLAQQALERKEIARLLELLDGLRPGPGQTDIRGFEWYYLWQQCHGRATLRHEEPVRCLAFSPDGRTLAAATGYLTGAVKLWDVTTAREKASVKQRSTDFLVFSPDGTALLCGGEKDKLVQIRDAATLRPLAVLQHPWTVGEVRFAPDGKTLVVAFGGVGEVYEWPFKVWGWPARKERPVADRYYGRNYRVQCAAFAPDSKTLVLRDQWGLTIWDTAAGRMEAEWDSRTLGEESVWGWVAVSPDGSTLATAYGAYRDRDGGGGTLAPCPVRLRDMDQVKWSPRPELLPLLGLGAGPCWAGPLQAAAWLPPPIPRELEERLRRPRERLIFRGHRAGVYRVAFSPDGKTLASVGSGGAPAEAKFWDVTTAKERFAIGDQECGRGGPRLAFSADGAALAVLCAGNAIKLCDPATGQVRATFCGHTKEINDLAFSPDGKTLASASDDGTVKLWDVSAHLGRAAEPVTPLRGGPQGDVTCAALSPERAMLATGSREGTVTLWDAATGQQRMILPKQARAITSLALSTDGRLLATLCGGEGVVRVWDTAAGQELLEFRGSVWDTGEVSAVVFSPDGRALASVSGRTEISDGITLYQICLWDASTGRGQAVLETKVSGDPFQGGPPVLAFAPDGKMLALAVSTWSQEAHSEVKVWDTEERRERRSLRGESAIYSLAFAPDGKMLATGSGSSVRLWDMESGQVREVLKGHGKDVLSIAFSPDGQTLASGGWDNTVRLWGTATGRPLLTLTGHTLPIRQVLFARDGNTLWTIGASGTAIGEAKVWHAALRDNVSVRED